MKIAVDAMGGDDAPEVVVQGALEAASKFGIHVILVGHEEKLKGLVGNPTADNLVSIHHCEDAVATDESPLKALRKKKDSSIRVAFGLVKQGHADAVISAGNSGATLLRVFWPSAGFPVWKGRPSQASSQRKKDRLS